MRFVLDEDVPAEVGRVIRREGHECWSAAQANLSGAADDELTVYADDKGAVLVAVDRQFSNRRRLYAVGRHLQFSCPDEAEAALLAKHFDDVLAALRIKPDIFVRLSVHGCEVSMR